MSMSFEQHGMFNRNFEPLRLEPLIKEKMVEMYKGVSKNNNKVEEFSSSLEELEKLYLHEISTQFDGDAAIRSLIGELEKQLFDSIGLTHCLDFINSNEKHEQEEPLDDFSFRYIKALQFNELFLSYKSSLPTNKQEQALELFNKIEIGKIEEEINRQMTYANKTKELFQSFQAKGLVALTWEEAYNLTDLKTKLSADLLESTITTKNNNYRVSWQKLEKQYEEKIAKLDIKNLEEKVREIEKFRDEQDIEGKISFAQKEKNRLEGILKETKNILHLSNEKSSAENLARENNNFKNNCNEKKIKYERSVLGLNKQINKTAGHLQHHKAEELLIESVTNAKVDEYNSEVLNTELAELSTQLDNEKLNNEIQLCGLLKYSNSTLEQHENDIANMQKLKQLEYELKAWLLKKVQVSFHKTEYQNMTVELDMLKAELNKSTTLNKEKMTRYIDLQKPKNLDAKESSEPETTVIDPDIEKLINESNALSATIETFKTQISNLEISIQDNMSKQHQLDKEIAGSNESFKTLQAKSQIECTESNATLESLKQELATTSSQLEIMSALYAVDQIQEIDTTFMNTEINTLETQLKSPLSKTGDDLRANIVAHKLCNSSKKLDELSEIEDAVKNILSKLPLCFKNSEDNIAPETNSSRKTVCSHINTIFAKLNVNPSLTSRELDKMLDNSYSLIEQLVNLISKYFDNRIKLKDETNKIIGAYTKRVSNEKISNEGVQPSKV